MLTRWALIPNKDQTRRFDSSRTDRFNRHQSLVETSEEVARDDKPLHLPLEKEVGHRISVGEGGQHPSTPLHDKSPLRQLSPLKLGLDPLKPRREIGRERGLKPVGLGMAGATTPPCDQLSV